MSSDEEDLDMEPAPSAPAQKQKKAPLSSAEVVDSDEEEDAEGEVEEDGIEPDDDDEDGEDDDDDDEEEEDQPGAKRRKTKRKGVNRYIEVEAEVDDEEDEEDEEDGEGGAENDFIEHDRLSPSDRQAGGHLRYDREQAGFEEQDAQELARQLDSRYKRSVRYNGEANYGSQKANLPGRRDPKIWKLRCKPGQEKNIVHAILKKAFALEVEGDDEMEIYSAFQRDSIPGVLYVEARQPQDVIKALTGLSGVYLNSTGKDSSRKGPEVVAMEDMVPLLTMKKKTVEVTEGMWVRVKRGKYIQDLAQVVEVLGDGLTAAVRLIPRIEYNPGVSAEERKRKKSGFGGASVGINNRPPQRLFNPEDVLRVYGRSAVSKKTGGIMMFQNEEFLPGGLLEKEYPITSLLLEGVNPTLDEIESFPKEGEGFQQDGKPIVGIKVNLDEIAEAARRSAGQNILPGDQVEVQEGEQTGLKGIVESVQGDIVTMKTEGLIGVGKTSLIEVPINSVRKTFETGDHVKVMSGKNTDESGLVLGVQGEIVTFWSDLSGREIKAFARDLREAAEVGSGNNRVGQYELHDLVMVDPQTAGVIFQTERDAFKILDQNGTVRSLRVHQISAKPESRIKPVGLDSQNREFRVDDQMKEIDGEGRKGKVLQIYRAAFAFLHSRDIVENHGVFVVRSKNLGPADARSESTGLDLSKQNPNLAAAPKTNAGPMLNLRHLINTPVVITKGSYKGLMGIIKDIAQTKARVELSTNNKVVDQDVSSLKRKDPRTGVVTVLDVNKGGAFRPPPSASGSNPYGSNENGGGMGMGPPGAPGANPYANAGGATPGLAYGMTPNPYAASGGKTPMPSAYGQTPNPYANQGGRTPGYAMGGATPAMGLGGRTPAPNYGGATPYGGGGGGYGSGSGYGAAAQSPYGGGSVNALRGASKYGSAYTPGGESAYSPSVGPAFLGRATPGAASAGGVNPYASTTPAGGTTYGRTPMGGVGDGRGGGGGVVLDENWSQGFVNIMVKVGPTLCTTGQVPPRHQNGQYDDQIFIITAHTHHVVVPLLCSVRPLNGGQILPMPISYLHPVPPTSGKIGENVMVVAGEDKGRVSRTTFEDRGRGEWSLNLSSTKKFANGVLCLQSV